MFMFSSVPSIPGQAFLIIRTAAAASGIPTPSEVLYRIFSFNQTYQPRGRNYHYPVVADEEMSSKGSSHLPKATQLPSGGAGSESRQTGSSAPACSPLLCRRMHRQCRRVTTERYSPEGLWREATHPLSSRGNQGPGTESEAWVLGLSPLLWGHAALS